MARGRPGLLRSPCPEPALHVEFPLQSLPLALLCGTLALKNSKLIIFKAMIYQKTGRREPPVRERLKRKSRRRTGRCAEELQRKARSGAFSRPRTRPKKGARILHTPPESPLAFIRIWSNLRGMDYRITAVRGAVSIPEDSDESAVMVKAVGELVRTMAGKNRYAPQDIVSLQMTQTSDLVHKNAAAALREALPEYAAVPLFCAAEPDVKGGLKRVVRILITYQQRHPGVHPVYLGDAALLRPDLAEGS